MADKSIFNLEGEAYANHLHKTEVLSFGMESRKLNSISKNYTYDALGFDGKVAVGSNKLGANASASGTFGHADFGYSVDYTSFVPKYRVNAGANLAEFSSEANVIKSGVEHKVASANVNFAGAETSFSAGGNTIIPTASGKAYSVAPEVSMGLDNARINFNLGGGPSLSGSADIKNVLPDANTIFEDPARVISGAQNVYNNPSSISSAVNTPWSGKSDKGSFGDFSAGASGIGDVGKDGVKPDFGSETPGALKDDFKSLTGRGGTEKGSAGEIYSSGLYRENLRNDADRRHNKNVKALDRIDKKSGFFANRQNNKIADASKGYEDRLNSAINQAELEKQATDSKMATMDPQSKEAAKLKNQSDKLGDEIDKLKSTRDNISFDKDRANSNLGRAVSNQNAAPKTTDQMVADAKANANKFENAVKEHGVDKHLADPAIDICNSRNELKGRMSELDKKINSNNNDINSVASRRDDLLNQKGMSLKDAIDRKDPDVAELNDFESKLRKENDGLRTEKGECQKAMLETDRNFSSTEKSAGFEQRDRNLQGSIIDNKNALEAKDNSIVNYCNSHGITKDADGKYTTPDNKQDENLQKLQNEKADLEKSGKDLENERIDNKKNLAESEKYNNESVKVSEKDGNALVSHDSNSYGKHIQNNEDLRGRKSQDESDKTPKAMDSKEGSSEKQENPKMPKAVENKEGSSEKENNPKMPKAVENKEESSKKQDDSKMPKTAANGEKSKSDEPKTTADKQKPSTEESKPSAVDNKSSDDATSAHSSGKNGMSM